ncbi:MAG: hypothetical protein HY657_12345 [Acidobacteria bacterium]|nr:hypothetical protein [Acidobacteriota bacterium]
MRRSVWLVATSLTLTAVVSSVDVVRAQGRGAGAGGRRGAPVATPPVTAPAGRAAPARPQGPPPVAERAAQDRGRGASAPTEAAGQPPVWARERRPPTASELVAHNPPLAARLQALLPDTDLQAASSGFSNLGQFVAAVHVSDNLDIPFDRLKVRMVDEKMSLGDAVRALRPETDADAAAERAERQARANMRDVRED